MQNARRAHKIRLCGHLRRYKKIVKKTYIIYIKYYRNNFLKSCSYTVIPAMLIFLTSWNNYL